MEGAGPAEWKQVCLVRSQESGAGWAGLDGWRKEGGTPAGHGLCVVQEGGTNKLSAQLSLEFSHGARYHYNYTIYQS